MAFDDELTPTNDADASASSSPFATLTDSTGKPVSDPIKEARRRFGNQLLDKSDTDLYDAFSDSKNNYRNLRSAFPDETKEMSPDQLQAWMRRVSDVAPHYQSLSNKAWDVANRAWGGIKDEGKQFAQGIVDIPKLFAGPKTQDEMDYARSPLGSAGPVGMAAHRMVRGFEQAGENMTAARRAESSFPGQVLAEAENAPMIGDVVKRAETGDVAGATGQAALRALTLGAGRWGKAGEAADATKAAELAAEPPVPRDIAGVPIPRTASQAGVVPASMRPVESFLSNVPFAGKPLRRIAEQQAEVPEQVIESLSGYAPIEGQPFSSSLNRAAQESFESARPIYAELSKQSLPGLRSAAEDILANREVADALNSDARNSLINIAAGNEILPEVDQTAREFYKRPYAKLNAAERADLNKLLPADLRVAPTDAADFSTVQDARSSLADLAYKSRDPNVRRLASSALSQLDDAIDLSLAKQANGTDLVALRKQANALWHRGYILDAFGNDLFDAIKSESKGRVQTPSSSSFNAILNDLDKKIRPGQTSELERAFPNPADRDALRQLGRFMAQVGVGAGGAGGMSSRMLMIRLLSTIGAFTVGHYAGAAGFYGTIGAASALSHVLASPGGARFLMQSIRAAQQGAPITRVAADIASRVDKPDFLNTDGESGYQSAPGWDESLSRVPKLFRSASTTNVPAVFSKAAQEGK